MKNLRNKYIEAIATADDENALVAFVNPISRNNANAYAGKKEEAKS